VNNVVFVLVSYLVCFCYFPMCWIALLLIGLWFIFAYIIVFD